MKTEIKAFGEMPDGSPVPLYILENGAGMRVEISGLGGTIIKLIVPDASGEPADVALGHARFEDYLQNPFYLGALIGRSSNRIADAVCELGGERYLLDKNNGPHNLHGGSAGLCFRLMQGEFRASGQCPSLRLFCRMGHLSDGFPGNLDITVNYTLQEDNTLAIDYEAVSDADTIINLTNHCYFNLSGHSSGSIAKHILTLNAPFYMPNEESCLPTGEISSVEGTPFDFQNGFSLGDGIYSDNDQIKLFGGYDHNLVLAGSGYRSVGKVADPVSGRMMEFFTTLPGVQLFTYNNIPDGTLGKESAHYASYQGFCLESQLFPNAVNMPWLRSPIYKAGQVFKECTAYRFGVSTE